MKDIPFYQQLDDSKKARFRAYKSQFMKQGLQPSDAIAKTLEKFQPHCEKNAPTAHYDKSLLRKVFQLMAKSLCFALFLSILLNLGIEALPHNAEMILMTEMMGIVGLCWPVAMVHPIWSKDCLPWLSLRTAGVAAIILSWLLLEAGLQVKITEANAEVAKNATIRKAIATSWDELDALPVKFVTKRQQIRNDILQLEERMAAEVRGAEIEGAYPVLNRMYRFLIVVFVLVTGHWVAWDIKRTHES